MLLVRANQIISVPLFRWGAHLPLSTMTDDEDAASAGAGHPKAAYFKPSADTFDRIRDAGRRVSRLLAAFHQNQLTVEELMEGISAIPVVPLDVGEDPPWHLHGPLSVVNDENRAGRLSNAYVDALIAQLIALGWTT